MSRHRICVVTDPGGMVQTAKTPWVSEHGFGDRDRRGGRGQRKLENYSAKKSSRPQSFTSPTKKQIGGEQDDG